jgi:ribosome-binding protein aMBF1 (putative translation factor)
MKCSICNSPTETEINICPDCTEYRRKEKEETGTNDSIDYKQEKSSDGNN